MRRDSGVSFDEPDGGALIARMLLIHVVITMVSILTWAATRSAPTTLFVGGVATLVGYSTLAVLEARRTRLVLTPLSFYFAWYALGLGFGGMYYSFVTRDGIDVRFASATVLPEDLAVGFIVYQLGSVALHAGMQAFRPREFIRRRLEVTASPIAFFGLVALVIIGVVVTWSPSALGALGSLATLATLAPMAAVATLAVTPRHYFGLPQPAYVLALVVGTAGVVVGNMASGSKAYLLLSVLPLAWHIVLIPKLRWWLPIGAALIAAAYLSVVEPTVNLARISTQRDGERTVSAIRLLDAFATLQRGELPGGLTPALSERVGAFLQRQFDPTSVAFLVGDVDANGLQWGDEMAYAAYVFIPRFIWPDKPPVTRGNWFLVYVSGQDSSGTSLGITATGELYWNFGTPGVLLGMFVIGCLLGQMWRTAGADPRYRPLHVLLYVITVMTMINMSEAVTVISAAIAMLLAFSICFAVLPHLSRTITRSTATAPA
jgi:hypothetical protein